MSYKKFAVKKSAVNSLISASVKSDVEAYCGGHHDTWSRTAQDARVVRFRQSKGGFQVTEHHVI